MWQVQKTKLEKQHGPKHGVERASHLTPVTGPDALVLTPKALARFTCKKVLHFPKRPQVPPTG